MDVPIFGWTHKKDCAAIRVVETKLVIGSQNLISVLTGTSSFNPLFSQLWQLLKMVGPQMRVLGEHVLG